MHIVLIIPQGKYIIPQGKYIPSDSKFGRILLPQLDRHKKSHNQDVLRYHRM